MNCPPVKINASGLRGGKTKIAGDISSQFLSALLMVAPYAQQPIEIEVITELNSKPYVDMTLAIMKDFGVEIEREGYSQFVIHPTFYSSLSHLRRSNPMHPLHPTFLPRPPSAAEWFESKISRANPNRATLLFSTSFNKWDVE